MQRIALTLLGLLLSCLLPTLRAVEPVPEAEQAARALKLIDAYHGIRPEKPPKQLHVLYFTPSDRDAAAKYEQRLDPILEDIRAFYRDNMQRLGFGPKTFPLERDASGKLVIRLVQGKDVAEAFPRWKGRNGGNTGAPEGGDMVQKACQPTLEAAGLSYAHETVLIFCHLATYDEKARAFRHHSPYFGMSTQESGLCFVADWVTQNLEDLPRKQPMLLDAEFGPMSLGKHTTIFIGGIAHEMGHSFGLPHCGERWDEKARGTSLMGAGNHTYREEKRSEGPGSFLTMASALRLASRPLFNGSVKGEAEEGRLERCELLLSTNVTRADLVGRRGTLRVEGTVQGTPPVYGVIAYFDSRNDGGYHAPTATSVPDAQGRFAIEVSDLAPCGSGHLRVEFCHANGAVSTRRLGFSVAASGCVDLTQWQLRHPLEPVAEAVAHKNTKAAQAALQELEASQAPALTKEIARKLAATLDTAPKLSPAKVPATITQLALGDAQPQSAEVGWLKPAANRVPLESGIPLPFLDSGTLYATGLYAHSPSRYVYNLSGHWKQLRGEAGLHTVQQPYAAGAVFVIKADGKELFRSPAVRGDRKVHYDVPLAGAKTLELLVENADQHNYNNWSLWLDPTLSR
jgi:hypothetical protein